MILWLKCDNCGKVEKFPYDSDIALAWEQAGKDGWVVTFDNDTFCCKECRKDCEEHYKRTHHWTNYPAMYRYQQQLKGEKRDD